MKVGDLVKLLDIPEVKKSNPEIDSESMGVITELGAGTHWVQWIGNTDWDCMYGEDLEVVNESW